MQKRSLQGKQSAKFVMPLLTSLHHEQLWYIVKLLNSVGPDRTPYMTLIIAHSRGKYIHFELSMVGYILCAE